MNTFHRIAAAWLHDLPNPAMQEQPPVSTTPLSFMFSLIDALAGLYCCLQKYKLTVFLQQYFPYVVTVQVAVCLCAFVTA